MMKAAAVARKKNEEAARKRRIAREWEVIMREPVSGGVCIDWVTNDWHNHLSHRFMSLQHTKCETFFLCFFQRQACNTAAKKDGTSIMTAVVTNTELPHLRLWKYWKQQNKGLKKYLFLVLTCYLIFHFSGWARGLLVHVHYIVSTGQRECTEIRMAGGNQVNPTIKNLN